MYHTVQLIICAFIIKRREMLINCNPLTFYWCAQICNIHKLQPIRIPNSSSTVFISILFLYTAHNALPFLQSRLVHCMFQRSSSIDYDQPYYCRTHKAKPLKCLQALMTTNKRLQLFDFIYGETGSLIQAIFMKSIIFPYRDYERPVVIAIQYISFLCVLKRILLGTPITKKFV